MNFEVPSDPGHSTILSETFSKQCWDCLLEFSVVSSIQESHGYIGESPMKCHKHDERQKKSYEDSGRVGLFSLEKIRLRGISPVPINNWREGLQSRWSQAFLSGVWWQDKRQLAQKHRTFCLNIRECFSPWGWPGTATGMPDRLWYLHSWGSSKAISTWSSVIISRWPCLSWWGGGGGGRGIKMTSRGLFQPICDSVIFLFMFLCQIAFFRQSLLCRYIF